MLIVFPGSDRFQAPAPAPILAAPLQELRGYWEALREDGRAPFRSQINPRGMEGALAGAFIVERVAPSVARFRIAGALIGDLVGCDPRGMPMSVLFDPRGRAQMGADVEQVFTGPALLELRLEAERGLGRSALAAQALLLPLRNDMGETDLAIGCLALSGEPGRRARRFFAASSTVTPLLAGGGEVRGKAGRHVAEPLPLVEGFAEPATVFSPPSAERSYLRLVRD
ncbi:PAS domain-containing protein [Gemmobacter tilapiae]|uniref:PAS domain-containing protein n=2 Tax=Neogemmobacter tilapiae TaxID=875041 RepID=A0A918TST9_9RHOB|nr:PAS domain-containing protein [Gemmobacter tilapiae]